MAATQSSLLDARAMARAVKRMADEIVELNAGTEGLIIVGIQRRGVQIAERIARAVGAAEGVEVPLGALDITLYRDDLRRQATRALGRTELPTGGIDGRRVILVDDVLFSGRTVRAALDALNDVGRPSSVQLAVLVDRGHRELPIRADYVGKNIPTSLRETVHVQLTEYDGQDAVLIGPAGPGPAGGSGAQAGA